MKKALIILSLYVIFTSCGGTDTTTTTVQDTITTTVQDTTTTTVQDTTTTTVQDTTTTTSVVGNLCDSCTYLSISELSSKPSEVPKLAWDDSQRILNENTNTDNVENLEIIINIDLQQNCIF